MTCAEFQKVLPYIIDTGGDPEQQEHLRDCSACAELVSDLQYIADQAKLLVPMIEPSPRVWKEIQTSLKDEGLVRPKRARGKLLGIKAASRASPTRTLPVIALCCSRSAWPPIGAGCRTRAAPCLRLGQAP